jgi:Uma2 family endonuclease
MTTMVESPRDAKPWDARDWTVDDLEHLPDDGRRYELLDGQLLVSPAPVVKHQVLVREVAWLLRSACPLGLDVLFAPVDWQPDHTTSLEPDVLVVRGLDLEAKNVSAGLELAVEVLSPSTRRRDLVDKRAKYESAGVASYWAVDPDQPSVQAWDLVDGRYRSAGRAEGDQELKLEMPFQVSLIPTNLLSGYVR